MSAVLLTVAIYMIAANVHPHATDDWIGQAIGAVCLGAYCALTEARR
jgi:hypothetical protein